MSRKHPRAYERGVMAYPCKCGAEPGEWCRRTRALRDGVPASDQMPTTLHSSRIVQENRAWLIAHGKQAVG